MFSNRVRHLFSLHARGTFIIVKTLRTEVFPVLEHRCEIYNKQESARDKFLCLLRRKEKKFVTETKKVMHYAEYWVKLESFFEIF
jgi:hypothetical protein